MKRIYRAAAFGASVAVALNIYFITRPENPVTAGTMLCFWTIAMFGFLILAKLEDKS